MTHVYEEFDSEGDVIYRREFKTLRGATSHGCARLRVPGYYAVRERHPNERYGYTPVTVAEWLGPNRRQIARVWI